MSKSGFLDAEQAALRLRITRASLYAYVSRGLIASVRDPRLRRSLFRTADVERLAERRRQGRKPRQAARRALDWGLPVLPSALTRIDVVTGPHYRGLSAVSLARTDTLEDIARLLWNDDIGCAFDGPAPILPRDWRSLARVLRDLAPAQRCLALFTRWQAGISPLSSDTPRADVLRSCGTLLRLMLAAVTGAPADCRPIHVQLAHRWRADDAGADALREALVLCADHELNASSFTTRCVASTGADLGACVVGGLSALSGGLHGGMTAQVQAMLTELAASRSIRATLAARLARDNRLPGFGHPLYPAGDPRGLRLLQLRAPDPQLRRVIRAAQAVGAAAPNLDLGLVALQRRLGLAPGSAFGVFALGRCAGWLAHALEQREQGQLIRPRAAYIGPLPDELTGAARGRIIRR